MQVRPLGAMAPAPLATLSDHVTAVWLVPKTVAVNVTGTPGAGVLVDGETSSVIAAGVSAICASATCVGSCSEVAVIVIVM
jgi:hypothetical protein